MSKSTKSSTKKTTKKITTKEEVKNKGLKLFGAFVNLFGITLYALGNTYFALKSVIKLNETTHLNLSQAVERVIKANMIEASLIFGDIIVFEFINYYLYLNKSRDILLGFVVIEIFAFIVAGYVFGFTYLLSYAVLIPAITGFINYVILVDEGE